MKFGDVRARRRAGGWLAVLGIALAALLVGGSAPAPAEAATADCSYGTGGPAADTFCWFDMSGYLEAEAISVAGQPFTISLGGGYTASFTLRKSDISGQRSAPLEVRTAPLEPRFAFGTAGYVGVAGSPILYSINSGSGTKGLVLELGDISVVDAGNNPVSGYRFVIADAENNVVNESFQWTSDQPLEMVAVLNESNPNGCSLPLPGIGTGTVTCTGAGGGGGPYNGVLVGAETPSQISLSMSTFARSGVAFAIQTAKLTLDKSVVSRVNPEDSFELSITSPEGTVIGSAATGGDSTASTGSVVVLSRTDGSVYTLAEEADAGSPAVLDNYDANWSCVNEADGSTTVLPTGSGASQAVSPAAGDDIRCTITNTAKSRSIELTKLAGTPTDLDGDGLVEVGDQVPYTFRVLNTGVLAISGVTVSDPLAGPVDCPPTTIVTGAHLDCSASYVLTQADIDSGTVSNTATASGFPPGATTAVVAGPSTADVSITRSAALTMVKSAEPSSSADFEVGTQITYSFVITNTGNVTITDVAVDEVGFTGTGPLGAPVCGPGATALAPGAQVVCSVDYIVTQEDVDGGSITNEAIATGTPPTGTPPIDTTPSSVTVPQPQNPNLAIVKSANRAGVGEVGDLITYSFTVTNTGNLTVTSPSVVETDFSGAGPTPEPDCPVDVVLLLPGQTMVCEATYRVVIGDLTGGPLRNSAVAEGTTSQGAVRSLDSSVSLPTLDLRSAPLPTTGFDIAPTLAVGGLLVAGGIVVLGIIWRRGKVTKILE